jgi:NADPH-dependent 2,4-dienoyl-CoA reductase/sulfur reductase-like enzyme
VAADGVILATGASARTLPELAGPASLFSLRTLAAAQALSAELQPRRSPRPKALGLEVTVIEAQSGPLGGPLGEEVGTLVGGLHGLNDVELTCGTGVDLFNSYEGQVTGVRLTDGRYVPADLVLVGIGAVPNIGSLDGSGVEAGNGVLSDASGRTSLPGIIAVGGCAAGFDDRLGAHRRMEHWTTATEHPQVAVAALLDQPAPQAVKVPYFWSDQYGVKLQFAGNAVQAERVAIEAGEPEEHNVLALYYRGEEPVAVLGLNQPRLFTKWRRALNTANTTARGNGPAGPDALRCRRRRRGPAPAGGDVGRAEGRSQGPGGTGRPGFRHPEYTMSAIGGQAAPRRAGGRGQQTFTRVA